MPRAHGSFDLLALPADARRVGPQQHFPELVSLSSATAAQRMVP